MKPSYWIHCITLALLMSVGVTSCNQDELPIKELDDLKDQASKKHINDIPLPQDSKEPVKPGIFLLTKNLVVREGKSETVLIDYQLITPKRHIRMFNPGKIEFDVNFNRDLDELPDLAYQIYSLETQSPLFQGTLTHSESVGNHHYFEAPAARFESGTNMMILSVIVKNAGLAKKGQESGGNINTALKIDFEELPRVENSINITLQPDESPIEGEEESR